MSDEAPTGEDVPEAVADWLGGIAEQRGVSESELLDALLRKDGSESGDDAAVERQLEALETDIRELINDVRERVIQVKRETDEKAPANHEHRDLRSSMEQLAHEVGSLATELEALDERIDDGFENYEEVLTYLTETTDDLQTKLGRLAAAVVDLRERAGSAAREEIRRTALSHLLGAANRHGVDRARCESCEEIVAIGLLVDPRCPHCDASFASLEPRRGFFRMSILHTGSLPALESAPEIPDSEAEGPVGRESASLADLAAEANDAADPGDERPGAPDVGSADGTDDAATAQTDGSVRVDGDLQSLDGVGPAYAERLEDSDIDTLDALAGADPEDLGPTIDVPAATVADWIEQAENRMAER